MREGGNNLKEKNRQITIKHEGLAKCPECGEDIKIQEEWDRLFDLYDKNSPSFDFVIQRLYKEEQPKYICESCGINILVK